MTKIEWVKNTDGSQGKTWNPVRGCTRLSDGCRNCYAEAMAARFSGPGMPYHGIAEMRAGKPRWTGKLAFDARALLAPLRRKMPTTWFVNSMSDLFHEAMPDAWIDQVFAVMALCPQHTFQILSKRAARMKDYCSSPNTVERIAALMYGLKYEQGTDYSFSGRIGRTRSRCRGPNMADQETAREAAAEGLKRILQGCRSDRLFAGSGGVQEPGRLSADYDDDRCSENSDRRPSGYLDKQQRANSERIDDQPQERDQRRQSLGEFGTGDPIRAEAPRDQRPERQPNATKGEQASEDADHGSRRFADAPTAVERHHGEDHRRNLRDETEGGFSDLHKEDLAARLTWPLANVWLGVSAEDQETFNEREPHLRETPAVLRFFSFEPLLGAINASRALAIGSYKWAIVGGESGPRARPMHPAWARNILDQCAAAGVPFFFKQWGEWAPADDWPSETQEDFDVRGLTQDASIRVGNRRAGRCLDGVEHNAMPQVRA